MPSPDRILAAVRHACDLVRSLPGRRGHLIDLSEADDVVVAGDLHGHVPNFQAIWKLADLAKHPRRHLVVQELIHGPLHYPGGGEKSHQLVDMIAVAMGQFPGRVHYLPGNHEMGQWTGRKIQKGDADLNEQFRLGVLTAYGPALMPDIYRAYFEFFQNCPLGLRTRNLAFISHSLPPGRHLPLFELRHLEAEEFGPKDYEPGGTAYGMVWGRDTTEETCTEFLRKVDCDWLVTGHIPADDGYTRPSPRHITLDCSNRPGGYVILPADRPLTEDDWHACIGLIAD